MIGKREVRTVVVCYFVASFAALGLPPYLTEMLPGLGDPDARWAGVLYIVPTVFSALGGPVWGRLADRFGRRPLLLRAQLGLAASFLLAGLAPDLATFAVALVLQGVLGGTFAASNAYLGAALSGSRLSWALTLMQGSARAALVAAPLLIGALSAWVEPQRLYLAFALLPAAAALLVGLLPEPTATGSTGTAPSSGQPAAGGSPAGAGAALHRGRRRPVALLCAYEFAFVFATVITYPYLIRLVGDRFPHLPTVAAAVLFALPHLCYLVLARPWHPLAHAHPRAALGAGMAVVAASLALHVAPLPLPALLLARVGLGAGMTLGLLALAAMAAAVAEHASPGRLFGSVELFSKAGAVAAGVVATGSTAALGVSAPLLIGATTSLVVVAAVAAGARTAVSSSSGPSPPSPPSSSTPASPTPRSL